MLKFVRILAFAELIGGALWLWPAVFVRSLTPQEIAVMAPAPQPTSPWPGLALVSIGTLSLAITARNPRSGPEYDGATAISLKRHS